MHVSVVDNTDASVVVTVRGNLDIDSAPVLTTTLDQVLERQRVNAALQAREAGPLADALT